MAFDQGHALIIGVGSHQYNPQYDVPITERDAQAVHDILIDPDACGYSARRVNFLQGEEATAESILKALDRLARRAKEEDTAFIYFAGHGAFDREKKDYYLATHDVVFDDSSGKALAIVKDTGLHQVKLAEKLKKIKAKRVLIIFNACHSGSLQPEALGGEAAQQVEGQSLPAVTAAALLSTGEGRIVISACKSDQLSSYFKAGQLTWFTDALKDGLMGKAMPTRGSDGGSSFISAFNLYNYIYEAVTNIAKKHKLAQDPMITVLQGVGPFPVALAGSSIHGLGTAESENLLRNSAKIEVSKVESDRWLTMIEEQTIVEGDYIEGDKIGQQYNIGGGAFFGPISISEGDVIGRDQIINITQDTSMLAWSTETEERYLRWVCAEFDYKIASHSATEEENGRGRIHDLYAEPVLSKRQIGPSGPLEAGRGETWESGTGTWAELVTTETYNGLLIGDMHDGKSLFLMKIAHDLAHKALLADSVENRDLPIYMPISRFSFPTDATSEDLLAMAALISRQSLEAFKSHWNDGDRKITLLIDDVDLLPDEEQKAFSKAVGMLAQSLNESPHSLVVACKPGAGKGSLKRLLTQELQSTLHYTEWVIRPLDEARRAELLDRYGAAEWLRNRISEDERLSRLVDRPGMLFALVRATKDLSLIRAPQNMAELYRLLINSHLFSDVQNYDYERVKQPVLSYLAFRIVEMGRNSLVIDDALYRDIVKQLEVVAEAHHRSRRVMPEDWVVQDWLKEIKTSAVVNQASIERRRFEFASPIYRDYYAALYLRNIGDVWKDTGIRIQESGVEKWFDVLILLSGMLSGKAEDEAASRLLNLVLSADVDLATDLWLEKGSVGGGRVPDVIRRDFRDRMPEEFDESLNPAIGYFRYVARDADPQIALQLVNGMMQLGVDAIDPLLDAVQFTLRQDEDQMYTHPLVLASALHALFHMGEFVAMEEEHFDPLIKLDENGFAFNNRGSCNATIGALELVNVPRMFRAEMRASIRSLPINIFEAPSSFELWHTPVAWFAIDYFQKKGVDWIGLAAACSTISRCARLIAMKAQQRGSLGPIVNEMIQCFVSYDRLGFLVADDLVDIKKDLNFPWEPVEVGEELQLLVDNATQVYKELRLLFKRANRSRMLRQGVDGQIENSGVSDINISQTIKQLEEQKEPFITLETVEVRGGEEGDLPNLTRANYDLTIDTISGVSFRGIHVERVVPGLLLAAEAVSLCGDLTVGKCKDGEIEGIVIDKIALSSSVRERIPQNKEWEESQLTTTNGIRARLSLMIDEFQSSKLVGIKATAS